MGVQCSSLYKLEREIEGRGTGYAFE